MYISKTKFAEVGLIVALAFIPFANGQQIATGQAAFADWNEQEPGERHRITVADLPEPNAQEAVNNTPHLVWGRPVGVAVGGDGALYVSDDGSRSVWRVAFTGK